jgi:hypothetical protein
MIQIVLDEQQSAKVAQANDDVQVMDAKGRQVGYLRRIGFSPEEIEEARRRLHSEGTWYTSEQVFQRLRELEERG